MNSLLFKADTIPWSEIEALVAVAYRWHQYTILNIVLIDRRLVRARQNALQALVYSVYGFPLSWPRAIMVNGAVLSRSIPALLEEIRRRYPQELRQHRIDVRKLDVLSPTSRCLGAHAGRAPHAMRGVYCLHGKGCVRSRSWCPHTAPEASGPPYRVT